MFGLWHHSLLPSHIIRFPGWCGPLPYSISVVYNLAINPVMVCTGFYLGADNVVAAAPQQVWAGLAIASGVAVLGMAVMGCAMEPAYRQTFYKSLSFRKVLDKLW